MSSAAFSTNCVAKRMQEKFFQSHFQISLAKRPQCPKLISSGKQFARWSANMFSLISQFCLHFIQAFRSQKRRPLGEIVFIVFAFVSTPVFAQAACAPQTDPPSLLDMEIGLPTIVYGQMSANELNEHRGIVLLNEAEGVQQINLLAQSHRHEEQWAYLPSLETWVEIGINEHADENGASVQADFSFLAKLHQQFPELHIYHYHPAAYFEAFAQSAQAPDASLFLADLSDQAKEDVALAMPSPDDIHSAIKAAVELEDAKCAPKTRFFVVTPLGVIEYSPTQEGVRRLQFDKNNPRSVTTREILTTAMIRRAPFNVHKTIAQQSLTTISDLLIALSAQFTAPELAVRYWPIAE